MKAKTNGIAAIHAARRSFLENPSRKPNSIMGIGTFNLFYPCSTYSGNVANMSIRKKACA